MIEQTLVMLKPSGVPFFQEAVELINGLGLEIADEQLLILSEDQTRDHYSKYVNEPFFHEILDMTKNPVWPILVTGENAIELIRTKFMPIFREKHQKDITDNACHCSDPTENPKEECKRHFGENGIVPMWRKKHHLAKAA